ncbi:MAG: hypothetical protein Q8Q52_01110, partial [Acidimicrobiia bacterium]|nr:hypothetical protein [Acidimicrobiia bacterium]
WWITKKRTLIPVPIVSVAPLSPLQLEILAERTGYLVEMPEGFSVNTPPSEAKKQGVLVEPSGPVEALGRSLVHQGADGTVRLIKQTQTTLDLLDPYRDRMGTLSDRDISALTHISRETIRRYRLLHNLPSYSEVRALEQVETKPVQVEVAPKPVQVEPVKAKATVAEDLKELAVMVREAMAKMGITHLSFTPDGTIFERVVVQTGSLEDL